MIEETGAERVIFETVYLKAIEIASNMYRIIFTGGSGGLVGKASITLDDLVNINDCIRYSEALDTLMTENSYWNLVDGTSSLLYVLTTTSSSKEDVETSLKRIDLPVIPKFSPANLEQSFMVAAMCDDEIPEIVVYGEAGTGKTYCAMSTALYLLDKKKYKKIILVKSRAQASTSSGGRMGDVPGGMFEKMMPVLSSYMRAFAKVWGPNYKAKLEEYLNKGIIEVIPLEYMRGEDFCDSLIIVDETQNIELHQFETLITRIGENSKVVFLADTNQIDEKENRKIKRSPIEVMTSLDKFKSSYLTTEITLIQQKRSELVSLNLSLIREVKREILY